MANPFEIVVLRLSELGFFSFVLPFMLISALMYGLLRKSRIFGPPEENVVVNSVVSLSAALLVTASPVLLGINVERPLSAFFLQSMVAGLIAIVVLMIAGFVFPPDLPKVIDQKFKTGFLSIVLVAGSIIGIILLVTSGLLSVFFPPGQGISALPEDLLYLGAVFTFLILGPLIVFGIGGKK